MFKKIISAAVVALAMTFASSSAQAAPQFLTPDVNFASHGDALFFNDSHNYSVSINTAVGDSMVIDNGTGFTPLSNATLGVSLEGGLGGFGLTIGSTDFVTGSLVSTTVNNNILGGKDIFAVFKITTSSVSGFVVGQLAGFDVLSFNMHIQVSDH